MEKQYVDLHVHTTYSDGAFSPEEAVRFAAQVGLAAISITDHDITDGIPAAIKEGSSCGVEIIPGVELSSEIVMQGQNSEMHILGYFIDWENAGFQEKLSLFRKTREKRAVTITEKLAQNGIKFDPAHLQRIAGIGAIGRLHFAKLLIEEGCVKNITEAFQKFLGYGKPAYVPKFMLKPEEALEMIKNAGGIPVLAHPHYGHFANREILNRLVDAGLKGIEVWHSKHPAWAVKNFSELAKDLGLIATGGSDCHGRMGNDPPAMGTIRIPYHAVTELKKLKSKINRCNSVDKLSSD